MRTIYLDYLMEKADDITKILRKKQWIKSYQIFLQSIKEKSSKTQGDELQTTSDTLSIGFTVRILDSKSNLINKYYAMSDLDKIKDVTEPKSTRTSVNGREFPQLKKPNASSIPGDYSNTVDMKLSPTSEILDRALDVASEYEIPFSHEATVTLENRVIRNSNNSSVSENSLRTNYNAYTSFDVFDTSYLISRNTAGRTLQLDLAPTILEIVNSTILRIKNQPITEYHNPAVLLHPDVMGNLLSNYFALTSLENKLDIQIWGDHMQLYDDPLRSKGFYSTLFDDEGSLTRPVQLLSDGKVINYLKDLSNTNWENGGNGFRMKWYQPNLRSYKFPVSPNLSNLVLEGGTGKGKYFTDRPGYVLVILQAYGYPGIGSLPSDFILHVSEAEIWKDGDPIGPISNLTLLGNLNTIMSQGQMSTDDHIVVNRSLPGSVYTGWVVIPPDTLKLR